MGRGHIDQCLTQGANLREVRSTLRRFGIRDTEGTCFPVLSNPEVQTYKPRDVSMWSGSDEWSGSSRRILGLG
jgi:hypothetical protein